MTKLLCVLLLCLSCAPPPPVVYPGPERLQEAVVGIVSPDGQVYCTGVLVRQGVLTAAHCIQSNSVWVAHHDELNARGDGWVQGRSTRVLRLDRTLDLALLDWRPALQPFLSTADHSPPVGSGLRAIGHPLALPYVMHTGHVSRSRARWEVTPPVDWYLANVSVVPGMSGGPVLDSSGTIVGLVSAHIPGHPELGIMVSAEAITQFLED